MALLFGVLVGLSLGLTGGGGSVFAVPMLIYGLGIGVREAISISLVSVSATAAFGAAGAMRGNLVDYRIGLIFAVAGMLTAPLGMRSAQLISETTILVAFATLMLVVAASMWRRASRNPVAASVVRAEFFPGRDSGQGPVCRFEPSQRLRLTAPCAAVLAACGMATGFLSGLFGVGGGFVIVPALIVATQIDIHRAVATSLFVIALVGSSGVASSLWRGALLPWAVVALFTIGGFLGMSGGRLLARHIAGPCLQKLFAAGIVVVALVVLVTRT